MSDQAVTVASERRAAPVALRLILWLALLLAPAAFAEELRPYAFEVKGGEVSLQQGVYTLDARIDFRISPAARDALQSGVPLTFSLDIEVERKRAWWLNSEVASLTQRYRVRYHALSDRYVLTNLNSGESRNFASESSLFAALGLVENLPVIDQRLLQEGAEYEVWLRARLDIDELPAPLKTVAYMSPQWRLESEWYQWPLKD